MTIAYRLEQRPDVEPSLLAAERALHVEGDPHMGRRLSESAYRAAERVADGPAMARAALGLGGVWLYEDLPVAESARVRACQSRALAAIEPRTSLAARLRARLCAEDDHRDGGHDAILRSLTEARESGDPILLAETLSLAHHCLMDPAHQRLRLRLAEELIGRAAWTGRRGDLVMGLVWRTVDLFLAADLRAERSLRELSDQLTTGDHLVAGSVTEAIGVMLAIRSGRLADAETLAAACVVRGQAAGNLDALGWYGTQLAAVRWYQGRLGELVNSTVPGTVDHYAVLALAAAAAGERRLALGTLARLRATGLGGRPRGRSRPAAMYGVVEAAHLLADAGAAAQVYELLTPYADLPMIAGVGVACFGSTHLALGTAALTMGQADRAVEHLRRAVDANLALGHWPATALSRWRLGHALALRDPGGKAARAELVLAEQEAAELGMVLPESSAPRRSDRLAALTCRRDGRQWELSLGTRTTLVDDSVGMRSLATLIASPGREIRAIDLAATPAPPDEPAHDSGAPSDQAVPSDQAGDTYREHLLLLQAEIADLESAGAVERAAACRAERDRLVTELAAAIRLGARTHRLADDQERARIVVGKAIRRALIRITTADPVIGDELRATVHTGVYCAYRPRR
ncbi:hypothetical protein [Nonomuraea insulae]|uniref:Uncharacterized protein n=1 Tax=Nonomuraea insulae TaxID=1616787 RepID=A0ABW1DE83_9ACTN